MAKWYGSIGYAEQKEVQPGVWDYSIVERSYYGDAIRNTRNLKNSGNVIDNVVVNNQLSIIADPYANQNFHSMVYAEYMGNLWKISTVDVQFPRLILTLGDLYNGTPYKEPEVFDEMTGG